MTFVVICMLLGHCICFCFSLIFSSLCCCWYTQGKAIMILHTFSCALRVFCPLSSIAFLWTIFLHYMHYDFAITYSCSHHYLFACDHLWSSASWLIVVALDMRCNLGSLLPVSYHITYDFVMTCMYFGHTFTILSFEIV